MPTDSPAAGFVEKWLQREPVFVQASLFVAPAQRALFAQWGALLFCLREAAFELSDPSVRLTKSGWWAQELLAITQLQAQHPLTQELMAFPDAPWAGLSAALLQSASNSDRSVLDTGDALAQMMPLASATVAVEAALLGGEANAAAMRLAAVHLLAQRLWRGQTADDAGRVPLQLLARHQISRNAIREGAAAPAIAEYARELVLAAPESSASVPLFRRMQWVIDRALLTRLAKGRPPSSRPNMLALWHLWHAARRGE